MKMCNKIRIFKFSPFSLSYAPFDTFVHFCRVFVPVFAPTVAKFYSLTQQKKRRDIYITVFLKGFKD